MFLAGYHQRRDGRSWQRLGQLTDHGAGRREGLGVRTGLQCVASQNNEATRPAQAIQPPAIAALVSFGAHLALQGGQGHHSVAQAHAIQSRLWLGHCARFGLHKGLAHDLIALQLLGCPFQLAQHSLKSRPRARIGQCPARLV